MAFFIKCVFLNLCLLLSSTAMAANCMPVSQNLYITSEGNRYYLASESGVMHRFSFPTRESAENALNVFQFNDVAKYCVVNDFQGYPLLEYFLTQQNKTPGYYDEQIEKCQSFIETRVKVFFDIPSQTYYVKSNQILLADRIKNASDASSFAGTLDNLNINVFCSLPGSSIKYWKSLYEPPPTDPSNKNVSIEKLKWEVDSFGYLRTYVLSRIDAQYALPVTVFFDVKNSSDENIPVSAQAKIGTDIIGQSDFSMPAKGTKTFQYTKKMVLITNGNHERKNVLIELYNLKDKSRKNLTDSFLVAIQN